MAEPNRVKSIVDNYSAESIRRFLSQYRRKAVQVPYDSTYLDENLRLNRQRYAESGFNDRAKSPAGATGAYQIMPITQKDYLSRGKGNAGNLLDPNYNRKIRDFALDIVPRDLGDTWSDDDSEQVRLAKQYAGYNWGAGSLKKYLRKQRNAGVDISNSLDWMPGLPKETRDYVDFIVLGNDVPGTSKTMDAYRKAWGRYSTEPFPEDSVATVQPDWSFDDGGTLLHDYKSGGKIHIKPENRGKFTALKKRTGHSASWFKAHGTPAQKKMAVFALNSRKWKHGDGGYLDRIVATYGSIEAARDAIAKLRAKKY